MPSHDNKGRSKDPAGLPHIRLNKRLIDSQTFHDLSGNAVKAYTGFLRKYNGFNNGWVAFGVHELAGWMPCAYATAQKAIIELEDAGVIRCEKIGNQKNQLASEWSLTDFAKETGNFAPQNYNPNIRFLGVDRKRYPKRCQRCSKNFKAQRSDAKWCSARCRQASYRKR